LPSPSPEPTGAAVALSPRAPAHQVGAHRRPLPEPTTSSTPSLFRAGGRIPELSPTPSSAPATSLLPFTKSLSSPRSRAAAGATSSPAAGAAHTASPSHGVLRRHRASEPELAARRRHPRQASTDSLLPILYRSLRIPLVDPRRRAPHRQPRYPASPVRSPRLPVSAARPTSSRAGALLPTVHATTEPPPPCTGAPSSLPRSAPSAAAAAAAAPDYPMQPGRVPQACLAAQRPVLASPTTHSKPGQDSFGPVPFKFVFQLLINSNSRKIFQNSYEIEY
jgi:hypothetical protein